MNEQLLVGIGYYKDYLNGYEKGKKIFINNKFYINPNKINPKTTKLQFIFKIFIPI